MAFPIYEMTLYTLELITVPTHMSQKHTRNQG